MAHTEKAIRFSRWANVLIFGGIGIIIVLILMMIYSKMLNGFALNPGLVSMFGTFIGGTVGAIWALAGIFLYYAALMYQREEIRLMIDANNKLQSAYDDQKQAYIQQIETAELQRFQHSFFEIYNIFLAKKDFIASISWKPLNTGKPFFDSSPIYAFSDAVKTAKYYAEIFNRAYEDNPEVDVPIYLKFDSNYSDKLSELCEILAIIFEEVRLLQNQKMSYRYEKLFLNTLTFDQLASIMIYSIIGYDNTDKLKNIILHSEAFDNRCVELLGADENLINFWTRYRSRNRKH